MTGYQRKIIGVSTHIYSKLLNLYPSNFRQAFGAEMVMLFEDVCQQVLRQYGPVGLLLTWPWLLDDLFFSIIKENIAEGTMMKKMLNKSSHSDLETMLEYEAYCQEIAGNSADYKEGVSAFNEKRKANFTGNWNTIT